MPSPMNLPPGWYAICETVELQNDQPNAIERFGLPLVVWLGKNKQWVVQIDVCPHRSARLSLGQIRDGCLTCPFHGFRFESDGTCSHVPEISAPAPGLRLETLPAAEKNGFLWVRWKDHASEIPWFEDLDQDRFRFTTTRHPWNTHFSRCVENQLDHSHLPFVHHNTIGRGVDPALSATTNVSSTEIRVDGLGDGAGFCFRFGNIWTLRISERLRGFIAFVPVNNNRTIIYMRHYQAFTRIPILADLACRMISLFNRKILAQDHAVVLSQAPGNVLEASSEHLFPSDRAIREFRRWLSGAIS